MSGRASLRFPNVLPYLAACLLMLPFILPALWALDGEPIDKQRDHA